MGSRADSDRFSRRGLLIASTLGMSCSHLLMAALLALHAPALSVLAPMMLGAASFTLGLAPLSWIIVSEMFPNRVRSHGLAIACATAYVAYMVFLDVPMYVSRWHTDLAAHHQYLSLSAGFGEILQRCTVMREWSAWRHDVPWLSLYFTVAVWISIALVRAPIGSAIRPTQGD